MTFPSPIQESLEQYSIDIEVASEVPTREGAATGTFQSKIMTEFLPWGDDGCFVLATTGVVELEYAAIRKAVAVFDAPCRGTIQLTGSDRLECLGRLTTQKVDEMQVGDTLLAFVTSRKGRVVADIIVRVFEDKILLDVDVTVVQQLVDHMLSYIVMENVAIENISSSMHWFWCIGPEANKISIEDGQALSLPKAVLGIDGVALLVETKNAHKVWENLVQGGCKPVGWFALNMARVEMGAPIFLIDFDTNNLPHEANVLSSRVRFDKGCYLGQEIIARMESLGKPKQKLMRIKMKSDDLPIAGTQLWASSDASGTPSGVVTSSAISPLGGSLPAVLAMVGKKNYEVGTSVFAHVGTEVMEASVEAL